MSNEAGKGDRRRQKQISDDEFSKRWDAIFKPKPSKGKRKNRDKPNEHQDNNQ